jgi:hypothetical protein
MVVLSLALLSGCEEEVVVIPIQDRCEQQGLALAAGGRLERADGEVGALALEVAQGAKSELSGPQLWMRLDGYRGGEGAEGRLVVRLFSSGSGDLFTRLDNAGNGQRLTLEVVDATAIPAGNVSATALDRYDCEVEKGKICLQVGVDTNGNGRIDDEDAFVFNGQGGRVIVEPADPLRRRYRLKYTAELGRNIMSLQSMSRGALDGCLNARYEPSGEGVWSLE